MDAPGNELAAGQRASLISQCAHKSFASISHLYYRSVQNMMNQSIKHCRYTDTKDASTPCTCTAPAGTWRALCMHPMAPSWLQTDALDSFRS